MRKTKYPLVAIIILNWNGKKLLKTCLSSLFKLTDYPNYQVIVVDNGSTDGSVEYVKKHFPKADVLALGKNYGYAKGNNEGIKYALKKYNPNYVLLLNNDTKIIQKNWLTEMVKVAESDEKIGIVGCKILFPNFKIQYAGDEFKNYEIRPRGRGENKEQYERIEESICASGPCFLVKTSVIQTIGFLDERFYPFWGEDVDYFLRLKRFGLKIMYCGTSCIIHFGSESIKKIENPKRWKIIVRNTAVLFRKHFPRSFLFLKIVMMFFASWVQIHNNRLRMKKNFFKLISAFIKGVKEGVKLKIGDDV